MSTNDITENSSRFDIEPEADASAGFPLEYAYQGVPSASDSMEPEEGDHALLKQADRLAAATREDRIGRYQEKHTIEVTS